MSKTFVVPKVQREQSLKFALTTTLKVLQDIDTPVSLACAILIRNNEFEQLVNKDIDPLDYENAYTFGLDYQAISILRKADFLPLDIDRTKVAMQKFTEAEALCKKTNDLFFSDTFCKDEFSRPWSRYLFVAANKIRKILGDLPEFSEFDFAFGPGASSTCKGFNTTIGDKFQSKFSLTAGAVKTCTLAVKSLPHVVMAAADILADGPFSLTADHKLPIEIVPGNRLMFVPKSAKTDRAICIEPHTNILLQKGVGSYLRERLRLNGIDLRNQAQRNADFARTGSKDGSYATIDLSSASDTVAYALVQELLPQPWFELLDSLRSPLTELPNGKFIVNEKFSSMGNGFTFELETIIFYAICLAVKEIRNEEGNVMCFGDDIIVPSAIADTTLSFLRFCGFTPNYEKTFIKGPFRESCGKDFFQGVNVRPFYIKELINYETDKFKIANAIRHVACRWHSHLHDYADGKLYRSWSQVVGSIPEDLRLYGPSIYGDSCIWVSRKEGYERGACKGLSFRAKILVSVPKRKNLSRFNSGTARAVSSYKTREYAGDDREEILSREISLKISNDVSGMDLPVRSTILRHVVKELPSPCWGWDEGSWIMS